MAKDVEMADASSKPAADAKAAEAPAAPQEADLLTQVRESAHSTRWSSASARTRDD